MAQNARHSVRARVGPQRPQKAGADENAVGKNLRQPVVNGLARVPVKAGPQRPALGEVTTTAVNNNREFKFQVNSDKDTAPVKKSQSSSLLFKTGPQRAPVFPGRSVTYNNIAAATASTSTTVAHGQIQRAQRAPSLIPPALEPPKATVDPLLEDLLEDEDMDIEEDVQPNDVDIMFNNNEHKIQIEEDELDDDFTPVRVAHQWPEVSTEKRRMYQSEVDRIQEEFEDEVDMYDMTMVSEYSEDIFYYMGKLELETMPNPEYMTRQTEISWDLRQRLVDWLLQVHLRYHMLPETLWIAINIVDRFLSKRIVSLLKLQLVGVTAMFIAAKYEEILAPSVDEFVVMTEKVYTREEILKGERIMLQTLEFKVSSYCTPYSWVRKISKADDYDIQTRTLSKFIMEVTLLDYRFLRVRPSLVAAVGMFTAQKMLGGTWGEAFVFHSGFLEDQLTMGYTYIIEKLIEKDFEKLYVSRKYANKKFLKASVFAIGWARKRCGIVVAEEDLDSVRGDEDIIVLE